MEYTNEILFKMNCKKNQIANIKYNKIKKIIKKIEEDNFLLLVLIISFGALIFDFILVKQFVNILNLL